MNMNFFPVNYSTLSTKHLLQLVTSQYPNMVNADITFLKRGFNDTYLITSNTNKFVLRVYKHDWRSLNSIKCEIELLQLLKEQGAEVSSPIQDSKGELIQVINAPEGERYAVLFSYANGNRLRKLTEIESIGFGKAVGKMHSITEGLDLKHCANDYSVQHQFESILESVAPFLTDYPLQWNQMRGLADSVIEEVSIAQLPQGICHGDIQAENVHLDDNNKITFFDFDFFGRGALVYDIAVFVWYDHKNKPFNTVQSFINGYRESRALVSEEIQAIPQFGVMRAFFQMALYCKQHNGKYLPIWPAEQVAAFVDKVDRWYEGEKLKKYQ